VQKCAGFFAPKNVLAALNCMDFMADGPKTEELSMETKNNRNALIPNIQLFGEPVDPAEDAKESQSAEQPAQEAANQNPSEPDSGLPKTQEELDAMIEKRLSRERKKLAKQQSQSPSAGQADTAQATAAEQYASDLKTAQRDLASARGQLEAIRMGVRPDLTEDAVALAMLEIQKAGDDPDEDAIRDALKAVLKRHPEWKQGQKQLGGIKIGAQQQEADKQPQDKKLYSGATFF
jgi:hypothetical protein